MVITDYTRLNRYLYDLAHPECMFSDLLSPKLRLPIKI